MGGHAERARRHSAGRPLSGLSPDPSWADQADPARRLPCATQSCPGAKNRWCSTARLLVFGAVLQHRSRGRHDRPGSRASVLARKDDCRLLQVPEQDWAGRRHRSSPDLPRADTKAGFSDAREIRSDRPRRQNHAPVPGGDAVSGRDLGASVRQRLLNQSRTQGRPFQEMLQYFAMERFLYRLTRSPFADRFVLKGALLLTAWRAPLTRPTMDIDLAGRTSNELDHIQSLIGEVCGVTAEPDGIDFNASSIEVSRIKEGADYEGVRVRFHATLAKARIPMQIDIGFGDVIVPQPAEVEYPAMLEFPPPILIAYPKETVVAEKLEALTTLGLLNSRIKDYYDLALLGRLYPFDGGLLVQAIRSTRSEERRVGKECRS